jgi:hypothetical protein
MTINEDFIVCDKCINRMKSCYSVQPWRIKLVLSVLMVLVTVPKADGMSTEDANQISDVTGHHKHQTGKCHNVNFIRLK